MRSIKPVYKNTQEEIIRLPIIKLIRYRISYAFTVLAFIILGISSKKFGSQLPDFIADHSGDMLWAGVVYFGFRCLFINKGLPWAFGACLLFSFFIEFSQLYQADWIKGLRSTTLGALMLGRGFLLVDLVRYFLGITVSWLADLLIFKQGTKMPSKV